jgi:hypothetical protein
MVLLNRASRQHAQDVPWPALWRAPARAPIKSVKRCCGTRETFAENLVCRMPGEDPACWAPPLSEPKSRDEEGTPTYIVIIVSILECFKQVFSWWSGLVLLVQTYKHDLGLLSLSQPPSQNAKVAVSNKHRPCRISIYLGTRSRYNHCFLFVCLFVCTYHRQRQHGVRVIYNTLKPTPSSHHPSWSSRHSCRQSRYSVGGPGGWSGYAILTSGIPRSDGPRLLLMHYRRYCDL